MTRIQPPTPAITHEQRRFGELLVDRGTPDELVAWLRDLGMDWHPGWPETQPEFMINLFRRAVTQNRADILLAIPTCSVHVAFKAMRQALASRHLACVEAIFPLGSDETHGMAWEKAFTTWPALLDVLVQHPMSMGAWRQALNTAASQGADEGVERLLSMRHRCTPFPLDPRYPSYHHKVLPVWEALLKAHSAKHERCAQLLRPYAEAEDAWEASKKSNLVTKPVILAALTGLPWRTCYDILMSECPGPDNEKSWDQVLRHAEKHMLSEAIPITACAPSVKKNRL